MPSDIYVGVIIIIIENTCPVNSSKVEQFQKFSTSLTIFISKEVMNRYINYTY